MPRLFIIVTPAQHDRIVARAAGYGLTVADYVRLALGIPPAVRGNPNLIKKGKKK